MGAQLNTGKGGPMADINVTPLVDVVLVLLIIFMVVTPMLSSGIDVPLPIAKSSTTVQDVGQNLVIGVKKDGSVYVDTNPSSVETVVEDMYAQFREKGTRTVLIKGDREAKYKDVRKVMDAIATTGGTHLLIATDKPAEEATE